MTIDDKAREANAYVQAALDGALIALQGVHQAAVEKPVDAASRLGFPANKAELIKDSHRRFLGDVYGGIRKVQHGLGDVAVGQVSKLCALAQALITPANEAAVKPASPPAGPAKSVQRKRPAAKKAAKKVAKKAAKKSGKKVVKKTRTTTKKKTKKRAAS
jgi:hypothetical protein